MTQVSGGSLSVVATGRAAAVTLAPANGNGALVAVGGAGPGAVPGLAVPGFADPASPGS